MNVKVKLVPQSIPRGAYTYYTVHESDFWTLLLDVSNNEPISENYWTHSKWPQTTLWANKIK